MKNGMSRGTLWMNGFWSQCQLPEHSGRLQIKAKLDLVSIWTWRYPSPKHINMDMIGVSYHFKPTSNFLGVSAFLYQSPFASVQISDKRLPLLHEMVSNGKRWETLLEKKQHVLNLPLRTKKFQTIEIYLTGGCGELISFLDGIVNMELHFHRQRPWQTVFTWCWPVMQG